MIDRLKADREIARKSRNKVIVRLLDILIGQCSARASGIQPVRALTDAEVISVVRKMMTHLDRAIASANATQLLRLKTERDFLRRYMPPDELSDEELEAIAVRLNSIMNFKQILDYLQASYAGRYDPKRAVEIVRVIV